MVGRRRRIAGIRVHLIVVVLVLGRFVEVQRELLLIAGFDGSLHHKVGQCLILCRVRQHTVIDLVGDAQPDLVVVFGDKSARLVVSDSGIRVGRHCVFVVFGIHHTVFRVLAVPLLVLLLPDLIRLFLGVLVSRRLDERVRLTVLLLPRRPRRISHVLVVLIVVCVVVIAVFVLVVYMQVMLVVRQRRDRYVGLERVVRRHLRAIRLARHGAVLDLERAVHAVHAVVEAAADHLDVVVVLERTHKLLVVGLWRGLCMRAFIVIELVVVNDLVVSRPLLCDFGHQHGSARRVVAVMQRRCLHGADVQSGLRLVFCFVVVFFLFLVFHARLAVFQQCVVLFAFGWFRREFGEVALREGPAERV
mmetsp:Transcript_65194/g.103791  ORF Transcript_65194/g.103791 Transcript_65194/m.103791 type:complete len:361 (-) Transcript_65194:46-1128(-)